MSYIEAVTERMGLWRELEDLENDLDNRRIRRKGYNRRRRILRQRLSALNKEVANYENRVNRRGDEYTELTQRLREAESEVRRAHTEIDRLKNQLQRGRLSQNAYMKRRDASDERLRKARTVIEEAILKLKRLVD
jgi:chromosome segregation ATPase